MAARARLRPGAHALRACAFFTRLAPCRSAV